MTHEEAKKMGATHCDDFIFTRCLDCNFSVIGEIEHCVSCGSHNVIIDALDKKEFTIDY